MNDDLNAILEEARGLADGAVQALEARRALPGTSVYITRAADLVALGLLLRVIERLETQGAAADLGKAASALRQAHAILLRPIRPS